MKVAAELLRVTLPGVLAVSLPIGDAVAAAKPGAAAQRQEDLKRLASTSAPVRGANLARLIIGKVVSANLDYEPTVPTFHFFTPTRVLVSYAKGMIQEEGDYRISEHGVCVTTRARKSDCFTLHLKGSRPAIMRISGADGTRFARVSISNNN